MPCHAVPCCAAQTPLHLAVEAGSADIVKLLLAAGANPNLLDFDGASPLHLVSQRAVFDLLAGCGECTFLWRVSPWTGTWTPWPVSSVLTLTAPRSCIGHGLLAPPATAHPPSHLSFLLTASCHLTNPSPAMWETFALCPFVLMLDAACLPAHALLCLCLMPSSCIMPCCAPCACTCTQAMEAQDEEVLEMLLQGGANPSQPNKDVTRCASSSR